MQINAFTNVAVVAMEAKVATAATTAMVFTVDLANPFKPVVFVSYIKYAWCTSFNGIFFTFPEVCKIWVYRRSLGD